MKVSDYTLEIIKKRDRREKSLKTKCLDNEVHSPSRMLFEQTEMLRTELKKSFK